MSDDDDASASATDASESLSASLSLPRAPITAQLTKEAQERLMAEMEECLHANVEAEGISVEPHDDFSRWTVHFHSFDMRTPVRWRQIVSCLRTAGVRATVPLAALHGQYSLSNLL